MNNSNVPAPQPVITPDDHAAYITITAALMTILSVMFYMVRLVIRFGFGFFASDDALLTAGTAFMILQVIATVFSVKGGIGRRLDALTSAQVTQSEISTYNANLLYLVTIALAKMSASQLNARLTRKRNHVIACGVMSAIIAAWGIASIVGVGVGCHKAKPWDFVDRCSDMNVAWTVISGVSILLELLLVVTPAYIIWGMQISLSSKIVVFVAFSFRTPIIALTILRLKFLISAQGSVDYTFDVVNAVVFTQVEMHYALVAATIPCMRPFLKALNSGYLATEAAQVDRTLVTRSKDGSNSVPSRSESVPLEKMVRSRTTTRSPLPQSAPSQTVTNFSKPRPRYYSNPPQLPSPVREGFSLEPYPDQVSEHSTALHRSDSAASDPGSQSSYGSERQIFRKNTQYTVHFDSNV